MHRFASGPKRNYYGKGDVIVYRLQRETGELFGANVLLLTYGEAFWPTYTTGDNTNLVATDSMKNFIQRETLNFSGADLELYCHFLAAKFLSTYPQAEGVQVSAIELRVPPHSIACVELTREGFADARSGIAGFRLLRARGSSFQGFVRDQYTTLPDITNRPLHMWLDLDWTSTEPVPPDEVRKLVHNVFHGPESSSIQQVIHRIGTSMLAGFPSMTEVNLEAQNRTWDTVVEQGDEVGIYTDPRPPYGCLGLTLRR